MVKLAYCFCTLLKLKEAYNYMNDSNNSFNPWLLPLTLGTSGILGFLAGKLFGQRTITADQILKVIRDDFKREGQVTGSWINQKKIPYQRFAVRTDAYEGGITRLEDNVPVDYQFIADAKTGSLLSLKRIDREQ